MEPMQGVDYIYSPDAGKRKANANLPGSLVYAKTSLDLHAINREQNRQSLEDNYPGYDPTHIHKSECSGTCELWNWRDYGIAEGANPTAKLGESYDLYSRAEAMKGSNQAVMMAGGMGAKPTLDDGTMPDLSPVNRPSPGNTVVVMAGEAHNYSKKNGVYKAGKELIGLGGR